MTTTETFVEATRRNQEAFIHFWVDGVQKFWGLVPPGDGKRPHVPSAEEVVDHAFDFAEKVLDTQREFVKNMLAVTRSVAGNTAWVAESATKDATNDATARKS